MSENEKLKEVEETPNVELEKAQEEVDETIVEEKKPSLSFIEENRREFDAFYKKQRKTNTILLLVVGFICIAVFLTLSAHFGIAIVLVAAVLVVLYIYSARVKKDMDARIQDYISKYYTIANDYVFNYEEFHNLEYCVEDKLADNEFPDSGFIKGISHVGSRNIVRGEIGNYHFKAADCVAKIKVDKKDDVCFLGKYFMIDLPTAYEHKTIIYIKPKQDNGSGPNDIDGLDIVEGLSLGERFIVWSNDSQVKTIFNKKFVDALLAFEPNEHLVDVAISIIQNKMCIALSYENELMVLPLLDPFKEEPTKQYAADVKKLGQLVKNFKL